MARHQTSVRVRRSLEQTFGFVGDLRNAPAWDPQTREVVKRTPGPVGVGTQFLLIGGVAGMRLELPYEIEQYDPPSGLVLFGETSRLWYRDRISLRAEGEGTWIEYDATLELRGVLRLGTPLLGMVFGWIGERATRGMAEAVERGTGVGPHEDV